MIRNLLYILLGALSLPLLVPLLPVMLLVRWWRPPGQVNIGLAVSDRWPDQWQISRIPYDIALFLAGARVITFSPAEMGRLNNKLDQVDGLLLTGGEDIDSTHYAGVDGAARGVNQLRDRLELKLLEEADKRSLPLLCVCRGAQLLAVHCGGSLKNIDHHPDFFERHVSSLFTLAFHRIRIRSGSRLGAMVGMREIRVNSIHHQVIADSGRLEVAARSDDGLIEAVELPGERFVLGVQWHPELLFLFNRFWVKLFCRFASGCRGR